MRQAIERAFMLDSMAAANNDIEAIDAINKYRILSQFGSSFTWDSIDHLSFYDYSLILMCMKSEADALKESTKHSNKSKRETFYFNSENDFKWDT